MLIRRKRVQHQIVKALLEKGGVVEPLYTIMLDAIPETKNGEKCIAVRVDRDSRVFVADAGKQDESVAASGCFSDRVNNTGWGLLQVSTTSDPEVPLGVRAYAAGLVEGLMTVRRMSQFRTNVLALLQRDTLGHPGLREVMGKVADLALTAWTEFAGGDAEQTPEDDIGRQAWAAFLQFRGIKDGFNMLAKDKQVKPMSAHELLLMNMHAELPALAELYSRLDLNETAVLLQTGRVERTRSAATRSAGNWSRQALHQAHGSAIVRRLGPKRHVQDLLVGHVTFGDFGEMTRVAKHYALDFGTKVPKISLTSYPGCIGSTDDYIVGGTGLVMASTSLWVPAAGEFSLPSATNDGLPSFLRAMVATRLATRPRLWPKVYGYVPGMGGANQWLVVDYGNVKGGLSLPDGTVWLVETLPTWQRGSDMTQVLREGGFFEVHGVPHFAQVREVFGLPANGPGPFEEHRRSALVDAGASINSLAAAKEVLIQATPDRRVDTNGDFLPDQLPISARYDLDERLRSPAGGIDAKVTSRCLVKHMALQARSGPGVTARGQFFSWDTEALKDWPHNGQPDLWKFRWVNVFPGRLASQAEAQDLCGVV